MKRAKRAVTLLLFFTLLFTMAACGQKAEDPVVTTTPSGSSPTTATSMPPSGEADIRLLEEEGWVNRAGISGMPIAYSDDGLYYTSISGYLRYFDKATSLIITLCQKAGCLHDEEEDREKRRECESIIGHPDLLFFYNGGIYFDRSDSYGLYLYRREADGTAEQRVAELGVTCRGKNISYHVDSYLFAEGSLYYRICLQKKTIEDNAAEVVAIEYMLLHLDLASGEEQELLRINDEEGGFSILSGHKDAVLITRSAAYDRYGGIDAYYNSQKSVQLLSVNSSAPTTLLEMTHQELGNHVYLSGGELYSQSLGAQTGRIFNLITGEQQEHTLPGTHLHGDYYLVYTQIDEFTYQWTLYNAENGQALENEKKDARCSRYLSTGADGAIFELWYEDIENLTTTTCYYYIAFSNMADGLQNEDFVEFFSKTGKLSLPS